MAVQVMRSDNSCRLFPRGSRASAALQKYVLLHFRFQFAVFQAQNPPATAQHLNGYHIASTNASKNDP